MQKLKCDYSAEYIPSWGKTCISITVFDDGNNPKHADPYYCELTDGYYQLKHAELYHGQLSDEDVAQHLDFMYNLAIDTCYNRAVAHCSAIYYNI